MQLSLVDYSWQLMPLEKPPADSPWGGSALCPREEARVAPETGWVRAGPLVFGAKPGASSARARRRGSPTLLSFLPPFSGPRRSAVPTHHPKARERVPTAAVSTMRAAVTPKTSTRTIAARHPASPAPRTTRATQTPLPSSRRCRPSPRPCRLPVRLLKLPRPPQEPPSFPHQGPPPLPLQALHRAPRQPPSRPTRLHRPLPTPMSSRHPPCTHSGCPPHMPHCSL